MTSDPGEKAATNRASDFGLPATHGSIEVAAEGTIGMRESPGRDLDPHEGGAVDAALHREECAAFLAPPGELSAVCVDRRTVLSWRGSEGASSHVVKRACSPRGPFIMIARVKPGRRLSYSDSPPNGTWFYQVTAMLGDLEIGPLGTVRVAVPGELRCWIPLSDGCGATAEGLQLSGEGVRTPFVAILMPGAGWAEGRLSGKALSFETATASLQLPSGLLMNLGDFTISMWTRARSLRAGNCLLHIGNDGGSYLRIVQGQRDAGGACLQFAMAEAGTGDEQAVEASHPMTVGRWAHVGVTLKASTGKIFLDGRLVAQSPCVSFLPARLAHHDGRLGWGSDAHPAFDGQIQDFRLFTKALTNSEIALLARRKTSASPEIDG
ncbi:MAG TPA: LamG domain-containing protein [Burkholderiaceae bacterium]|nr:LamG domain-containing protein [Burkholderiaceae bacterium]